MTNHFDYKKIITDGEIKKTGTVYIALVLAVLSDVKTDSYEKGYKEGVETEVMCIEDGGPKGDHGVAVTRVMYSAYEKCAELVEAYGKVRYRKTREKTKKIASLIRKLKTHE